MIFYFPVLTKVEGSLNVSEMSYDLNINTPVLFYAK